MESIVSRKAFNFARKIIIFCSHLDKKTQIPKIITIQLLKSGTSIGANIEEALAAQSKKDFLAKMYISFKEANETHYWLRLIEETKMIQSKDLSSLISESKELKIILSSITKSTKNSLNLSAK